MAFRELRTATQTSVACSEMRHFVTCKEGLSFIQTTLKSNKFIVDMLLLVYSYNETYTMKPLKSRAIRYVQLLQFVSGLTLSCLIFNYYL